MAQYLFGAGAMVASADSRCYGNTIATPTPVEMGVLQSVSVDFGFDLKTLLQSWAICGRCGTGQRINQRQGECCTCKWCIAQ